MKSTLNSEAEKGVHPARQRGAEIDANRPPGTTAIGARRGKPHKKGGGEGTLASPKTGMVI